MTDELERECDDCAVVTDLEIALYHIDSLYHTAAPETVLGKLRKLLRELGLASLADMLDPDGRSGWQLKLCRRHGSPGKLSRAFRDILRHAYDMRVAELKAENRAAPAKAAIGDLARRYDLSDEEIREAIKRSRKRKRRSKPH